MKHPKEVTASSAKSQDTGDASSQGRRPHTQEKNTRPVETDIQFTKGVEKERKCSQSKVKGNKHLPEGGTPDPET